MGGGCVGGTHLEDGTIQSHVATDSGEPFYQHTLCIDSRKYAFGSLLNCDVNMK